jgi:hypothetical protein
MSGIYLEILRHNMILSTHGVIASQIQSFVGLLDTYPNAAAAYSVRKLRAAYTGNAIRVRRSSDNAEQNIGFTALGNLDTTALTSFCSGTNGFVTTWYDQSDNAVNSNQTIAVQQPQIVSSGAILQQNTKPTIVFSGFSNSLILSSNIFNNTTPKDTFCVFNTTDTDAIIIGGFNGGFLDVYGNGVYTNSTIKSSQIAAGVGVLLNSTITPSGRYLVNSKMVSGQNELFVDSISKATSTNNQQFQNYTNRIGGDAFNGGAWLDGNIQEIIIYPSNQDANRTGISTNINTYYAIY